VHAVEPDKPFVPYNLITVLDTKFTVDFMKKLFKQLGAALSIALLTFCNSYSAFAASGVLAQVPIFLSTANANLILAIDDSGSMDSEVLFASNDGALWWHTSRDTYVGVDRDGNNSSASDIEYGQVSFNLSGSANGTWKKFTYLFPNGTGGGNRVYSDSTNNHYAIPTPLHNSPLPARVRLTKCIMIPMRPIRRGRVGAAQLSVI
jgi:hypothetical protein